jgi:hypothetical protein
MFVSLLSQITKKAISRFAYPLMALKLAASGLHAGPVTMTRVIMITGMAWGVVLPARLVNACSIEDLNLSVAYKFGKCKWAEV